MKTIISVYPKALPDLHTPFRMFNEIGPKGERPMFIAKMPAAPKGGYVECVVPDDLGIMRYVGEDNAPDGDGWEMFPVRTQDVAKGILDQWISNRPGAAEGFLPGVAILTDGPDAPSKAQQVAELTAKQEGNYFPHVMAAADDAFEKDKRNVSDEARAVADWMNLHPKWRNRPVVVANVPCPYCGEETPQNRPVCKNNHIVNRTLYNELQAEIDAEAEAAASAAKKSKPQQEAVLA
jgi:hypothetical protein